MKKTRAKRYRIDYDIVESHSAQFPSLSEARKALAMVRWGLSLQSEFLPLRELVNVRIEPTQTHFIESRRGKERWRRYFDPQLSIGASLRFIESQRSKVPDVKYRLVDLNGKPIP